jgi:hypothetical protein
MAKTTITLEFLNALNGRLQECTEAERCRVANDLLDALETRGRVSTVDEANKVLWHFVHGRLESDDYFSALSLLIGFDKYDPRPHFSKVIFDALPRHAKLLMMGCSGSSKTFSVVNWAFADWLRDPENTNIRIGSVNGDHLRGNAWSALVSAYDSSVLPMPGQKQDLFIGIDPKNMESGIQGIIFPQSAAITARVKGIKPGRRTKPHPKFGIQKRVRIILDEAAQIPDGVFEDLSSPASAINGPHIMKIILCGNPDDRQSKFAEFAVPPNGWDSLDLQDSEQWESQFGYHVVRLDGLKSENVIQRKQVYPGIISYDAFLDYLKRGDSSAAYYTYGRGWFPQGGSSRTIMGTDLLSRQRGEPVFIGKVDNVASIDLAFTMDRAVMYIGRYGLASGFRDKDGQLIKFTDRLTGEGVPKPRHVLHVEGYFELPQNKDTIHRSRQIIDLCKKLKIDAEFVVLDKSGNGSGVYDYLRMYWGDVLGIMWGEDSSELKVLADDDPDLKPKDLYDRMSSELWFATKRWLEAGAIYIGCNIPNDPLFKELSSRRYKTGTRNRIRTESKDDYKARGNDSPDHADSFVMLQQLLRTRCEAIPGLLDDDSVRVTQRYDGMETPEFGTLDDPDAVVLQTEGFSARLED